MRNTLQQDLRSPLHKVERVWIRRPATVIISLIIIPIGAVIGAYEMACDWYSDCW